MKEVGILAAVLLMGVIVALLVAAGRQLSHRRARTQPWVLEENTYGEGTQTFIKLEAVRGHERLELDRVLTGVGGNWTMDLFQARSDAEMSVKDLNRGVAPHKVLNR
jgi:hypothetical protein